MKKNIGVLGILTVVIILIISYSCQKEIFKSNTTDDVNISQYLERYPEKYSMLTEMLERSKTQGFLGAYGTYTLFAPDNNAIGNWIREQGKNNLGDFSEVELLDFVKYHVIKDTVGTTRFTDGKIKSPTLFGEYLYTDVFNGTYRINKTALLNKSNIFCGNGVIHEVDKVLIPPAKSLAELIESNPDYSIFTAALKATGFFDTLSYVRGTEIAPEKRFQTVIVESDSLFNANGINSFDDLRARYSTKNDPTNPADSLWLFVAYHITNQGLFLEDIAGASTLYTLAPKEIISTKLESTKILLNETVFNGVLEPGAEINRTKSDVLAVNGVLHETKNSFNIKVRLQVPVYFDLGTSPELLAALGASYRNAAETSLIRDGKPIANSVVFNDNTAARAPVNSYRYDATPNANRPYANSDYINLEMCAANAARVKYIDFKTPYLVKGRYKVWVCYAQNGNGAHFQVKFNPGAGEQVLPNIVNLTHSLTAAGFANSTFADPATDNLLLAAGYKRYLATSAEVNENGTRGVKQVSGTGSDFNVGRLAGIINVETTDRHVIRLEAIGEGRCISNQGSWLDMIHFIPADDVEQNYPRFHPKLGELFYRPQ